MADAGFARFAAEFAHDPRTARQKSEGVIAPHRHFVALERHEERRGVGRELPSALPCRGDGDLRLREFQRLERGEEIIPFAVVEPVVEKTLFIAGELRGRELGGAAGSERDRRFETPDEPPRGPD